MSSVLRVFKHFSRSPCYLVGSRSYGSVPLLSLKANLGSRTRKRRKGRGPNNKIGKGHKGARVRQGNRRYHRGWEGDRQTPIHLSTPKFDWHKWDHHKPLQWLDLKDLLSCLNKNKIRTDKVITMRELYGVSCIKLVRYGLALVNNYSINPFPYKIHIEVTFVTPGAKESIENGGGIVRLKYYNMRSLRWLQKPYEFEFYPISGDMDSLPRPRWRHMFPDYPQLHKSSELEYLQKYIIHPQLLPKNVSNEEKLEQQKKLKLQNFKYPKVRKLTHTNIKDKLFRWARHR